MSEWRDGARRRSVELTALRAGRWRVRVDDAEFELSCEVLDDGRMRLTTAEGIAALAEVTPAEARRFVRLGTADFILDRESDARRGARAPAEGAGLEAPMPGVVTRVLVSAGDEVQKGQALLALEAMKMEHLVRAPRAGRVRVVLAQVGVMVQGGATLVELEPVALAT